MWSGTWTPNWGGWRRACVRGAKGLASRMPQGPDKNRENNPIQSRVSGVERSDTHHLVREPVVGFAALYSRSGPAGYTATNCAAGPAARFGFFTLDGPNREPAARPAVSATPGSRDTMAATMAPSISSAS